MAEDDQDRASELAAEREAEIEAEMERVGEDPDQVPAGSENLGTQSADTGKPDEAATGEGPPDRAQTSQEEAQELPDGQQADQWAESGGDQGLAGEATAADRDEEAPEAARSGAPEEVADEGEEDEETDEATERPAWARGAGDDDRADTLLNDEEPTE